MLPVINWLDTIDSTNNEALRHVSEASDITVWAAKFQTNGRGQKGNTWESAVGENLTFSILLKPIFIPVEEQFIISQLVTLGIIQYLHNLGVEAKIKWPNDIYVQNKKICGILIEHHICGANLSASIIGIGLNLNQTIFATNAPNPTSLSIETGDKYVPAQELKVLVDIIAILYNKLSTNTLSVSKSEVQSSYYSSLYRINQFHKYENPVNGEIFEAKIVGIDHCACLLLEQEDGTQSSYAFKEIKYII